MSNIAFDIETLGSNSDSIILSAALIHFDIDVRQLDAVEAEAKYKSLCQSALFVKFNVEQQHKLGRKIDRKTLDWWKQLDQPLRDKSFTQDGTEMDCQEAIKLIREYGYAKQKPGFHAHPTMWSRGGFDGFIFDNLCKMLNVAPPFGYWTYNDFRTAINITYATERFGYVRVPNFDHTKLVRKHDPIHDCAYDVMQLLHGA